MLVIGLTFTLVALGQKNDPEAMLGGGLHQEEVEANCKEAIKIYQKVTEQKNAPRNVMARAQLHIGICREKLALREARAAYQEVLEKYADQREIAVEATRRLTGLGAESKSSAMPQEFLGAWNGIVDEPLHPHPRYPATVSLFGGGVGTVVGTFAYLDPLDCGGEWILKSVSSDTVELIENLRPGVNRGCADNASVTLKLGNSGALEYRWRHSVYPNIATATLSKSAPQGLGQ
jgi:hypothetical protein